MRESARDLPLREFERDLDGSDIILRTSAFATKFCCKKGTESSDVVSFVRCRSFLLFRCSGYFSSSRDAVESTSLELLARLLLLFFLVLDFLFDFDLPVTGVSSESISCGLVLLSYES